jgi:hypothetical protein
MIIISILVCAVLAYFCAVFVLNKKLGYSLAGIFIALFIISVGLLVANENNHLGMEKVTEDKTVQLSTVKKGF